MASKKVVPIRSSIATHKTAELVPVADARQDHPSKARQDDPSKDSRNAAVKDLKKRVDRATKWHPSGARAG
jgi:hypothetical protein